MSEHTAVDEILFAEAVRAFLVEKHVPWAVIDEWADELVAIAREHPLDRERA